MLFYCVLEFSIGIYYNLQFHILTLIEVFITLANSLLKF